jgi:hypothetical protein
MVGEFNNKTKRGIIPRSINYIYNEMDKILKEEGSSKNESKFSVYLSFIQIYLESIQDLLDTDTKDIKIREQPDKGVELEGANSVKCDSPEQCAELFHLGEKNRATESTRMNAHSSRSHAILILKIERSIKVMTKVKVKNIKQASDRLLTHSKLYLVDLAGSERVKKTGATNMRLEEAKKINSSLLALGNVISALTNPKSKHISYRDSKLTRLLQDSLGGNAKTSLIVTVSPSTYNTDETVSSLLFANRAMKVQNKPVINEDIDYRALNAKLQEELDKLNDEYGKLKIEYEKVVTELETLKKGEKYLEIQKSLNMNNSEAIVSDSTSTTNTNNSSNGTPTKGNENVQKLKNDFKKKMKKLEQFYENLMKVKAEEYENILKKADNIVYEKETQLDQLTSQINELNNTIKTQKADIDDLTKERDDLQKSVIDLSSQVQDHRDLLSQNRTEKEYKALIEQLNDTITTLENKIVKMEDTTTIDYNSKDKISSNINEKIADFQNEINHLTQKINDCTVKKGQNEIKLKLSKAEALKSKSMKENLKTEIIESQRENFKLIMEEESTNKRIDIIEKQIECAKNIDENLDNLINEYINQNKLQLVMNLINKEIDNRINEETIKNYEDIFSREEQKQFTTKFELFKGEGDLNSIVNRVLYLNNNYQTNIFKLDNINRSLNNIITEPNNEEKLSEMRDNIQTLLEETQEINKLVKKEMKKDFSSTSLEENIPFERCIKHLDKLFTNITDNFNTLVDSYNVMNSNVCLLLTILDTGSKCRKSLMDYLSKFIEESIDDLITKKNLNNQINILNQCGINTGQFFNNLEQLIKDSFEKLIKDIDEGNKEVSLLNARIDDYKRKNCLSNNNDKETEILKKTVEVQNKTINGFKLQISEMQKGVNQLNNFLELNQEKGKLDVKKITKIFNGYTDKINGLTINLNDIEKKSDDEIKKFKEKINQKDINTGKYLFGQFFSYVSEFSNNLYNYGFKDDN